MGKTRALSGHVRNAQSAVGIRLDMENECSRVVCSEGDTLRPGRSCDRALYCCPRREAEGAWSGGV